MMSGSLPEWDMYNKKNELKKKQKQTLSHKINCIYIKEK